MATHTAAQLAQYCVDHHYTLQTQGTHMTSWINWTIAGDVGIFAAGWVLGRWGWDVVVSWIKAAATKISGATSTAVTEVKAVV
jgi:hypothetical protein